jgi:hypothetical protein
MATIVLNTNSYVSADDADDYFDARYGYDLWEALTADQKAAALISAASHLDSLCFWYGYKTDIGQALAFPRNGETEAPAAITIAQMEIAYSMVAAGSAAEAGKEDPLTALTAGDVSLSFKGVGGKTGGLVSDYVKRILVPHGDLYGSNVELVRA